MAERHRFAIRGSVRMGKLCSALVAGALTLGSVGLVACGSDDSDSGDKGDSGGTATGKKGGTVKIGSAMPDNYDPVMFQTVQANQPLQLVYTGLVTYRHAEGAEG